MATVTKLDYLKRLRGADLTPTEYMVLSTLCTYSRADLTGARPGWNRLIEDTLLGRSTVKRAVTSLTLKGFLVLVAEGGNAVGKGFANEYRLTLPVIHKGSVGGPLSDSGKGSTGEQEGVQTESARGPLVDPHQVSTSSGPRVIIPHASHAATAAAVGDALDAWENDPWMPMLDDFDVLEIWLETELIGLDTPERTLALALWEKGDHPQMIRNTINRKRRDDDSWGAAGS